MLINFTAENYRSIRDEVRLELTPTSSVKDHDEYLLNTGDQEKTLLPVISIYGNNGSGKSTLLRAANFMKWFILNNEKLYSHGDPLPVDPFMLDIESRSKPTSLAMEFCIENTRYYYKFSIIAERVTYEALHAYPNGSKQVWFERKWRQGEDTYDWRFSHNYHGGKLEVAAKTLGNNLYFSKAVKDADPQLIIVYNFFREKLSVSLGATADTTLTYEYMNTPEGKGKISSFMKAVDVAIDNITVETTEAPNIKGTGSYMKVGDKLMFHNTTSHHKVPGTDHIVSFPLEKESTGTVKIFRMAGLILNTLATGGVLFIDEIEQGLHFRVQHFLINLFNNPRQNKNRAQLIFSTHSPLILNEDLLRRDQVWFTAKNSNGSTRLYSLINVAENVKDKKPVRRGQDLLQGFLSAKFYEPPKIDEEQLFLFDDEDENKLL